MVYQKRIRTVGARLDDQLTASLLPMSKHCRTNGHYRTSEQISTMQQRLPAILLEDPGSLLTK